MQLLAGAASQIARKTKDRIRRAEPPAVVYAVRRYSAQCTQARWRMLGGQLAVSKASFCVPAIWVEDVADG
jgi:hypothetical protein